MLDFFNRGKGKRTSIKTLRGTRMEPFNVTHQSETKPAEVFVKDVALQRRWHFMVQCWRDNIRDWTKRIEKLFGTPRRAWELGDSLRSRHSLQRYLFVTSEVKLGYLAIFTYLSRRICNNKKYNIIEQFLRRTAGPINYQTKTLLGKQTSIWQVD